MTSPDYGMQVFLFWRTEVADRDLRLVKEAGFRWVRMGLAIKLPPKPTQIWWPMIQC
jgi:hypothetical protein